jgi:hypothetical protein
MKVRDVVAGVMLAIAIISYAGFGCPASYKLCAIILTIGFFGCVEGLLLILPSLASLWLVALVVPPIWASLGMNLLFAGLERFASWDIALPWFWIICTAVLYVYAVAIAMVETVRSRY